MWRDSTKQIGERKAKGIVPVDRGDRSACIFVGREDRPSGRPRHRPRQKFQVGKKVVSLKVRLKLLELAVRPTAFGQSFPDGLEGDLQAGGAPMEITMGSALNESAGKASASRLAGHLILARRRWRRL
jgi:hypothetical protein